MEKLNKITIVDAFEIFRDIKNNCFIHETWPYGGSDWHTYDSDDPYAKDYIKSIDNLEKFLNDCEIKEELLVLYRKENYYLKFSLSMLTDEQRRELTGIQNEIMELEFILENHDNV